MYKDKDYSSLAYWEHFPHPADMGIRGIGPTPEAAFEQAALAMMAIMVDLDTVEPQVLVQIQCQQPDLELLLLDWLNSLLYQADVKRMVFCRFKVVIDKDRLDGSAWGQPIDPKRHVLLVEVKAATMASLAVAKDKDGKWVAQCIVDV